MDIQVNQNNGQVRICMQGRLDNASAALVQSKVEEVISGATDLEFDFAKVDYVSSAGLRVLLLARKRLGAKGEISLLNVNEVVHDILEMSGFLDILNVK